MTFTGAITGLLVRGLMCVLRYANNSTTIGNGFNGPYITEMNDSGSGYSFKSTYANGKVTLYMISGTARSQFKLDQEYSYQFLKYT